MDKIHTLETLFLALLPFLLLEVYIRKFYNVGLLSIGLAWSRNYKDVDFFLPLSIGSGVLMFILWVALGASINSFIMSFSKDNIQRVYKGNQSNAIEVYLDKDTGDEITYSLNAKERYFNIDFKTIYTYTYTDFKNIGSIPGKVEKSEYFTRNASFKAFLFFLSFVFPFLILVHVWAYPVMTQADSFTVVEYKDSFKYLFDKFSFLGEGVAGWKFFTALTVIFFFMLIFFGNQSNKNRLKSDYTVPSDVRSFGEIEGVPLSIHSDYSESSHAGSGSRGFDTGYRYVVFEFDDGFPSRVYVSLKFDKNQYPDYEEYIEREIKSGQLVNLRLDKDLTLLPVWK